MVAKAFDDASLARFGAVTALMENKSQPQCNSYFREILTVQRILKISTERNDSNSSNSNDLRIAFSFQDRHCFQPMNWHYSEDGKQIGPITEAQFEALVKFGVVTRETLVWKEGFPEWIQFSEADYRPVGGGAGLPKGGLCAECGRDFSENEMVNLAGVWVCGECKPQCVQKIKEGLPIGTLNRCWRSGKRLVVPINAKLPHRCVKCNVPTDGPQMDRKLYWHHPAVYLGLLVNVVIYVILALCCRKSAKTSVSICPKHRSARRNVILLSCLLVLGGLAGSIAGVAWDSTWGIFLGLGVCLGAIILGIVRGRLVYAAKITKEYMWLGGCNPAFLQELPNWSGPK